MPNFFVGGTEQWALSLIAGIPHFDWTVSAPDEAISHPVGLQLFAGIQRIRVRDIGRRADVVIGCTDLPELPRKQRIIMVAHGVAPYYQSILRRSTYGEAVAVSQHARTAFPKEMTVKIIYNGIDIPRLRRCKSRQAVRAQLGIPGDGIVVGYIGRFSDNKNPLAAGMAASTLPNGIALYAGPGPDTDNWLKRARELSPFLYVAAENVDHIGDLYAACDVCIFASRSEGFCLAMAEAWYVGTPVVATPVGIAAEEPCLAVIVPLEPTADQLGVAIRTAIDSADAGAMRQRAQEAVVSRYESTRMVSQWREFLLCENAGASR